MTGRAKITKVRILKPSYFGDDEDRWRRPHVGQRTTFRLNRATGVLTVKLFGQTYCDEVAARASRCGA